MLQAALDDSIEHARDTISSSHDLLGLQKACTNAFGLYKRTRPPAAPESVARAKGLPKEGMHPLLASKVPVTSGTGLEAQVCCTFILFICVFNMVLQVYKLVIQVTLVKRARYFSD